MTSEYRVLIADDEPLVQIGLKSIFDRDFPGFRIVGTASNGVEAFDLIGELKPDIVITDIKMPRMSGLELTARSRKEYGRIPVFIILTAYEDFEMARQAISNEAADYLVKIELSSETLKHALDNAVTRVNKHSADRPEGQADKTGSLNDFRQKFAIKLLNNIICDRDTFYSQAEEMRMDFSYNRYIVIYAGMNTPDNVNEEKQLKLYSSTFTMTKDILLKYSPCHCVANDMRHFTFIFYFNESEAIADKMQQICDGVENAIEMIDNYFNVHLYFGIGTAVSDPLDIHTSFEEARAAIEKANDATPIRLFSHIVGANRRSGKDKLISSIQQYIDENLDDKLQLTDVAEVFGLSGAYLSTIFKKNADIGFSEYVYTKKIEKAKEMLLNDDMKIYEVADALSFESAYYFSKVFKKVEGLSPREWLNSKL